MSAKWDKRFLKLAYFWATFSKDPDKKLGCAIVDDDRRVLSIGFNGFPAGIEDSEERLNDRDFKLSATSHAEGNAMDQADGISLRGATIYVTQLPCTGCTRQILRRRLGRVVCPPFDFSHPRWGADGRFSLELFREAGVQVDFLEIDFENTSDPEWLTVMLRSARSELLFHVLSGALEEVYDILHEDMAGGGMGGRAAYPPEERKRRLERARKALDAAHQASAVRNSRQLRRYLDTCGFLPSGTLSTPELQEKS